MNFLGHLYYRQQCLTPKFSSNAAPITTPPLLIIAFTKGKIPPRSALGEYSHLCFVCRNSRKFSCTFLNCFIGQALMHAPQPMHADSSTLHTQSSLSGFHTLSFDRAFVGTRRTAAAIVLVIQLYMFSWAGKIPSSFKR